MRKSILLYLSIILFLGSCAKDSLQPDSPKLADNNSKLKSSVAICGEAITYDLPVVRVQNGTYEGIGSVVVSNDATNLYVQVNAPEGLYLFGTFLTVGAPEDLIIWYPYGFPTPHPTDPWSFLTKFTDQVVWFQDPNTSLFVEPYTTTYTYVIPLAEIDECVGFNVFVKMFDVADPRVKLNVYAQTTVIENLYCEQDCEEPCFNEETAWSFGTTFQSLTGTTRWGWYSEYAIGTPAEYVIYAGQTNEVGTLFVSDNGTDLTVTFKTDGDVVMGLAHLFAGSLTEFYKYINKKGTPVPGQVPYHQPADPYTNEISFTIPLSELVFDGQNLVIAAHAETYLPCL